MNKLYPIFLKLKGKSILIVGGGLIAQQKLIGLINTDAELTILAPVISDEVRAMQGSFPNKRKITFIEREYQYGDEKDFFMVIAATEIPELNNSIANRCRDQMIMSNSVDEPESCDFYVPSIVEEGDLKIAISSNGKAPAVAQKIRLELEKTAKERWSGFLNKVSEFRNKVKSKLKDSEQKNQAKRRMKLVRWFTDRAYKQQEAGLSNKVLKGCHEEP